MRNNLKYGTLLCCALLLLAGAGCRTHKHVTATEVEAHSRVETAETRVKADSAKTDLFAFFSDSARVTAASHDSVFFVFSYDSTGRINTVRGSRHTTETSSRANTQSVQAASQGSSTSQQTTTAAADTTKHQGAKETTSQTEAGGNVLSTIDKAVGIAVVIAGLVFCAWLVYRLRKLNEKWEQRDR